MCFKGILTEKTDVFRRESFLALKTFAEIFEQDIYKL